MAVSTKDLLKDAKMLSRVLQSSLSKKKLPVNQKESLSTYLKDLLNQEISNQENAMKIQQNKQIRQNIKSQINALQRYDSK